MTTDRRLAAILYADIAGYSRLMGDDEDATVKTLRSWREQVSTLITNHRGNGPGERGESGRPLPGNCATRHGDQGLAGHIQH